MALVITTPGGAGAVLEVYNSGWKFIGCMRSYSVTITGKVLETTVTGDGLAEQYVPAGYGFTVVLEGLQNLDPTVLSLPYLEQCILNGVLLRIRDVKIDLEGNTYTKELKVYLTEVTDTNSFDNVSAFTAQAQGTGAVVQSILPPSTGGPVKRYPAIDEVQTAPSGDTVVIPLLINKDIISVVKDGKGGAELISSGTPVENQVLYTSATGTFQWYVPFEPGEQYYIIYQDL